MARHKPRRYIILYRTRYLGKPVQYELDADSTTDAVGAFAVIVKNKLLKRKFHSVVDIKVKPETGS